MRNSVARALEFTPKNSLLKALRYLSRVETEFETKGARFPHLPGPVTSLVTAQKNLGALGRRPTPLESCLCCFKCTGRCRLPSWHHAQPPSLPLHRRRLRGRSCLALRLGGVGRQTVLRYPPGGLGTGSPPPSEAFARPVDEGAGISSLSGSADSKGLNAPAPAFSGDMGYSNVGSAALFRTVLVLNDEIRRRIPGQRRGAAAPPPPFFPYPAFCLMITLVMLGNGRLCLLRQPLVL
jgi:hypothetical protein